MRWLILALLIVPAIEIGLFIWIGGKIGPLWVILLIILTGIIGIAIAKQQGRETLGRVRLSMNNRKMPADEIIDGICIFTGAIFMFTPGFFTDAFGFLLIIPATRGPFKLLIYRFIKRLMNKGTFIHFR